MKNVTTFPLMPGHAKNVSNGIFQAKIILANC